MHCVICDGLEGCGQRYIASVLHKRTAPARLSESLVSTLGFCGRHTTELFPALDGAPKFRECALQAAQWLKDLTASGQSYGERFSEILFLSRGHCPACLYRRRLEGRLVSRFFRCAPTAKRQLGRYLEDNICLNHLYAAVPGLHDLGLGGTAARAYNATLKRLRRNFGAWDMENYPADARVPELFSDARTDLARMIGLSTYAEDSGYEPQANVQGDAAARHCRICAAVRDARRQWRSRLNRTVGFGYSLRLVAPACPEHVVACLLKESPAAAHAAWSRFLQPENRSKKIEAAPGAPAYRRKGASWHLPHPEPSGQVEMDHDLSHLGRFCPACGTAEIARTRAALCFSAQHRSAPESDIELCLKHFAEVYILEPRKAFREDLAASRMSDLQAYVSRRPVWAFGTFS